MHFERSSNWIRTKYVKSSFLDANKLRCLPGTDVAEVMDFEERSQKSFVVADFFTFFLPADFWSTRPAIKSRKNIYGFLSFKFSRHLAKQKSIAAASSYGSKKHSTLIKISKISLSGINYGSSTYSAPGEGIIIVIFQYLQFNSGCFNSDL